MTHRLAVLLSGVGSNLQAILDAIARGDLNAKVVLVLSNRATAPGLDKAQHAGIPTVTLNHQDFADREAFDLAMIEQLDRVSPDTLVLAGFMRILSSQFVRHYQGRLLNIHPSLLPKYPGLNTHQRALQAGDKEHGCSVHFVTEELDGGPIIARCPVPVYANDTLESLSNRVHEAEHQLYPQVLQWRAEHRLFVTDTGVLLDGNPLPPTGCEPL